jgi:hypothetical protein
MCDGQAQHEWPEHLFPCRERHPNPKKRKMKAAQKAIGMTKAQERHSRRITWFDDTHIFSSTEDQPAHMSDTERTR